MSEDLKVYCVNENCEDYCEEVIVTNYSQGDDLGCDSCRVKLRIKSKSMEAVKNKTLTIDEVEQILSNIKFSAHSCIDMGWKFKVSELQGRFIIQTSFQRKDIRTGELGTGWGRENITPIETATEMSVIMTAWMAIETVVKHELMESFEFKGAKILNPHKTIDELAYPEILPENR